VTRLGHAPHCGDGAEFPWDCTCDLPDFREDLEEAINALPALLAVAEAARDAVHAVGTSFWPVNCDRLRAALARLDGAL